MKHFKNLGFLVFVDGEKIKDGLEWLKKIAILSKKVRYRLLNLFFRVFMSISTPQNYHYMD